MHVPHTDAPTLMPDMTRAEVERALSAYLRDRLRPVSIGMALLYTMLTVGHLLVLPDPVRLPMVALASGSTLAFALIAIVLGRTQLPERLAHPVVMVGIVIVLANSLAHLLAVPELKHSTNVALLVIMIGAMLLSVRWFVAACALAIAGWLAVVFAGNMTADLVHYLFLIGQALLLSTTIFLTRRRGNLRIIRLRHQERGQRLALAALAEERSRAEQIAEHARERAEAASQAKSSFLANMTHELRTPLTSIMGYSELLERQLAAEGAESAREDLGRIRQASQHLMALINEILDLSTIEAGRIRIRSERIEVRALVDAAVTNIQPLAARNQNQIDVQIAPGLTYFFSDEVRVRQIVINLMSNACKFTKEGTITLAIELGEGDTGHLPRAAESSIHFAIRDTGVGIAPEQQRFLFQEYSKIDVAMPQPIQGTGLGLALSRRLARLMGGDIMVSSQPGVGSCFCLSLPYRAIQDVAPAEHLILD